MFEAAGIRYANPIREHGPTTTPGIVYSSMPTMHANEQLEDLVPSDRGGSMLAKPCPESIVGGGLNGKSLPFHQFEGQAQSKIFAPYWSMETVNEALEVCLIFNAIILLSTLT
jgi:DIS3-like exonuclease 2